jgi:hypothetical protein
MNHFYGIVLVLAFLAITLAARQQLRNEDNENVAPTLFEQETPDMNVETDYPLDINLKGESTLCIPLLLLFCNLSVLLSSLDQGKKGKKSTLGVFRDFYKNQCPTHIREAYQSAYWSKPVVRFDTCHLSVKDGKVVGSYSALRCDVSDGSISISGYTYQNYDCSGRGQEFKQVKVYLTDCQENPKYGHWYYRCVM